MFLFPLLHEKINFIDEKKETVKPSLCHSYRSSIKRQVIALPLHGQNTAAIKLCHGAGGTSYIENSRSYVFGKQARLYSIFAEFLLFLFIFPIMHSGVGLTVMFKQFSCYYFVILFPLLLGPIILGGFSAPNYRGARRRVSYYSY